MKKTSKLIGAALSALVAIALVISCSQASDPKDDDPVTVSLTDEFQTYWLNISDADLAGLEGFHLKNLSDASAGIIIDRIVATDTKSLTDANLVDVYTFSDPETGTNYWGFGAGTIADGVWSSGEIAAPQAPDVEVYSTGFATGAFSTHSYVGIVAKNLSTTVSGNKVHFVPIIVNPDTDKGLNFEDLFIY